MKTILRYRVIVMFLLCAAFCRAEKSPVTHNFHSMSSDPLQLSLYNSEKVGVTPLVTYTCTGTDANIWLDVVHSVSGSKRVSINLPAKDNFVTTSAIEDLAGIRIWHFMFDKSGNQIACPNVKLQLSRDSVNWTDAIIQDGMYSTENIDADFVPGRYFVRLTNTTSTKVSLYSITYRFDSGCNCVLYIPE